MIGYNTENLEISNFYIFLSEKKKVDVIKHKLQFQNVARQKKSYTLHTGNLHYKNNML